MQALSRGKAWVRGYSPASLVPRFFHGEKPGYEAIVQLASFPCRFFHGEKPGNEAIVQLASFPCRLFHGEKPGYEAIVQLASFPGSFTGKSLGTRL